MCMNYPINLYTYICMGIATHTYKYFKNLELIQLQHTAWIHPILLMYTVVTAFSK